jgi:hypothetical protein
MVNLSTILLLFYCGVVLLPEFQRGYVWNRDQVRGLMFSLYRGYPIGGLLFWETEASSVSVRGSLAGRGVSLRGRLFDRDVQIRVDVPLYVHGRGRAAPSVLVALNDLW